MIRFIIKTPLLVLALYFSVVQVVYAAVSTENAVKVAFIIRFVEFTDNKWVPNNDKVLDICVYGKSLNGVYKQLEQKIIIKRKVSVSFNNDISKSDKCNIVYFANSFDGDYDRFIAKLKNKPILTIGDKEYFTDKGGMIEFFTYRGKVRFKINNKVAQKVGINFNAKLLELSEMR